MSIMNLLPDDYIKRRLQRRANILCAALFAVVISGVIGATMVSERSLARTQQILDRVNADYEEAAKLLAQMGQLNVQRQAMLVKAKAADTLQERVPRSFLLGTITNAMTEGMSLTNVQLSDKQVVTRANATPAIAKGATLAGAPGQPKPQDLPPSTVEMDIRGLAGTDVDVARFIATLAMCPLCQSVDLVFSQEKKIDDFMMREFQVRAELKPNIDVIELMKDGTAQQASGSRLQTSGTTEAAETATAADSKRLKPEA